MDDLKSQRSHKMTNNQFQLIDLNFGEKIVHHRNGLQFNNTNLITLTV